MSIIVQSQAHDLALARMMLASKREAAAVVRQEFGLVLQLVAKHTPPASQGVTGAAAKRQGRAKVAGDINSLYGRPNDAYAALQRKSRGAAAAYWRAQSAGNEALASAVVAGQLGKSLAPFDGGAIHKRTMGGSKRRRGAQREVIYYVRNTAALDAYIAKIQSHVLYLASGWAPALRALGRALPYGVGSLPAPGTLRVLVNDSFIEVAAVDQVKFASGVRDIERRIRWAMQVRTDRMQRAWDHYIASLGRTLR